MMPEKNLKIEYIDILVTCMLFVVGCAIGKLGVEHFGESIWAFNIPAIGLFLVGELIFYLIKRVLSKLFSEKKKRLERKATLGIRNQSENGVVI